MTIAGFKEWSRFHRALTCIHHAQYDEMLAEMEPIFIRLNATVEEMDAASLWLWENPEQLGRDWGEHGGLLRRHILRSRAERQRGKEREERASFSPSAQVLAMNFQEAFRKGTA
jgi:hypothetical protein